MTRHRRHLVVLPVLVIALMASGFSLDGKASGTSAGQPAASPQAAAKSDLLLPRKS
jgi:hypothetical protein